MSATRLQGGAQAPQVNSTIDLANTGQQESGRKSQSRAATRTSLGRGARWKEVSLKTLHLHGLISQSIVMGPNQ